jgi:hypothetical protein
LVKGAFIGPSDDIGVNQRSSSLANPADIVVASATASGKIWGNLGRIMVVTPSKVESFLRLMRNVVGNGNGLGTLIQKDWRKSGT